MRKSFLKIAAVTAASILFGLSFVSCDDDDKNNDFESKIFTVELPTDGSMIGYGPSYSYSWRWTNRSVAAADSIKYDVETGTLNTTEIVPYKEIWTFKTKETGVRELKFNYVQVAYGIKADGNGTYKTFNVLKDTVIKF